jgi:hypothetical protein
MHVLVSVFFLGGENSPKCKKNVAGESPLIKDWTKQICCHILTLPGKQ